MYTVGKPIFHSPVSNISVMKTMPYISDHLNLTHAEKSLLIAEKIFPMAVELHALPIGQCFIVSFIYHRTLHTDVMVESV